MSAAWHCHNPPTQPSLLCRDTLTGISLSVPWCRGAQPWRAEVIGSTKGRYCTLHSPFSLRKKHDATKLWKEKMGDRSPPRKRKVVCPFLWTDICCLWRVTAQIYHICSYLPPSWKAHLRAATRQLYFPLFFLSYIQSGQFHKIGKYSHLVH